MADLIDRAALLEKKTTLWDDSLGWTECVDIDDIEAAPAVDAVEVVRCKDCKHWEEIKHGHGWCCASTPNHALTKDDDFCSYGERRTNATDRC